MEGSVVEDIGDRGCAHGGNPKRPDPVKGELRLEDDGVRTFLGAFVDGGRGVVGPYPVAKGGKGG